VAATDRRFPPRVAVRKGDVGDGGTKERAEFGPALSSTDVEVQQARTACEMGSNTFQMASVGLGEALLVVAQSSVECPTQGLER